MIRFTIRVRGAVPVVRADSRELLDHCRASLGVTRAITLLEMEGLGTPALYGVFRPRLLLPQGFLDCFSEREVRLVFLHELAHLKAHDILLNWLIAMASAIHWFNPVTWLALRRLRHDREILRDAQVLHRLDPGERATYGQTLLKLSEQLSGGVPCPSFIPVINHRSQITRRILMITRFRRESRASNFCLAAVIALLALATFTRTNSFGAELSAEMTTLPYALNAEKAGAPLQIAGAQRTDYQLAGILEVSRQDNAWPVEEKVAFRVRVSGHQYNVRTETANGWAEAGFNGKESIFIKSMKSENERAQATFSNLPPRVQQALIGPDNVPTNLRPADLFVALNDGFIVPRCVSDASLPVVWLATASAGYFETAAPSRILKFYDMSRGGGPVVPLDYVLMDGQPRLPQTIAFYDREVPGPGSALRRPIPSDTNAGGAHPAITPRGFARLWPIPFCTNGLFAVEETTNVSGLILPLRFRLTVFNRMSSEEADTPAPIPDGSYTGFVTNIVALTATAMLPTLPEGVPMQFSDARWDGGPYSYTTNRLLSEAEVRATRDYRNTHQVEQSGEQLQLRRFGP
jgi:hypothetical protein